MCHLRSSSGSSLRRLVVGVGAEAGRREGGSVERRRGWGRRARGKGRRVGRRARRRFQVRFGAVGVKIGGSGPLSGGWCGRGGRSLAVSLFVLVVLCLLATRHHFLLASLHFVQRSHFFVVAVGIIVHSAALTLGGVGVSVVMMMTMTMIRLRAIVLAARFAFHQHPLVVAVLLPLFAVVAVASLFGPPPRVLYTEVVVAVIVRCRDV